MRSQRRFIRPMFSAIAILLAVSACKGHISTIPQSGSAAHERGYAPASFGRPQGRALYTAVDAHGFTPDGRYKIRTLHASSLKIHQVLTYVTPSGTYTQQEYSTPYGLLTVVQTERQNLATPKPGSTPGALPPGTMEATIVAKGTTSHGGSWRIVNGIKPNMYSVRIVFDDSEIQTIASSSVPIPLLRALFDTVY